MTSDKSRAAEIWQAAKAKLRHILHKDTMAQWFDNIVIVDMDGSDIILGVSDEFFADDKCLGQTVRRGLFGIFEPDSEITAVTQ